MPDHRLPAELTPFEVFFDSSEANPALPEEMLRFAGNLGFPAPPPDRPWVYSNFVQSLDGMVTFGGRRPAGRWVAQSRHDRWMMDLLRAHADAVLYGANSLIEETRYSGIPGGPVFRIVDPQLLRLRHERLGRGKQRVLIVTGSGALDLSEYRLFRSEDVEAWVVTTAEGSRRIRGQGATRVLTCGEGSHVDLAAMLRALRTKHGIRYLLCEGGPTLYGYLVHGGWMDEKFLTIAPQEIGPMLPEAERNAPDTEKNPASWRRMTTIEGDGFSIETARWYGWISCRKAGSHEFNRYRFARLGPDRTPAG